MRGTQAGISVPEESAGPAEEEVCLGEMADSDQAPAHSDDQASSGSPDHSLLPGGSSQSGSHLCVSSLGLDACHNSHGEHGGLDRCCTDHTPVSGLSLGFGSHYCGTNLCVPAGCCSDAPYTYAGHKGDDGHLAMAGYCFLGSYIYIPFANLPDNL